MAGKTKIAWATDTWNPVVGCSVISPACTNCYAMAQAARIERMSAGAGRTTHYAGTTQLSKAGPVWTGKLALAPDHILTQPLRWRRPRRIFVNSMSDLFHEDMPTGWIDHVFAVMALAPQHTFQILTKRSARMREYLTHARRPYEIARTFLDQLAAGLYPKSAVVDATWPVVSEGDDIDNPTDIRIGTWPLPNVWLGVTAEDQRRADERIPDLLATPAARRFVSVEPMLGPVDLTAVSPNGIQRINALSGHSTTPDYSGWPRLDWVICGGESGPNARPMHSDWARGLRDQCAAAGVPYFFKQWGEFLPVGQCLPGCGKITGATSVKPGRMRLHYYDAPRQEQQHAFADNGVEAAALADDARTFRVGTRRAGDTLDGRQHHEFPEG